MICYVIDDELLCQTLTRASKIIECCFNLFDLGAVLKDELGGYSTHLVLGQWEIEVFTNLCLLLQELYRWRLHDFTSSTHPKRPSDLA